MHKNNCRLLISRDVNLKNFFNKNLDLNNIVLYEFDFNEEFGIDIFYEKINSIDNIEEFLLKTIFRSEDFNEFGIPKFTENLWNSLEKGGYIVNGFIQCITKEEADAFIKNIISKKNIIDKRFKKKYILGQNFINERLNFKNIKEVAWWRKSANEKEKMIFIVDEYIYLLSYY